MANIRKNNPSRARRAGSNVRPSGSSARSGSRVQQHIERMRAMGAPGFRRAPGQSAGMSRGQFLRTAGLAGAGVAGAMIGGPGVAHAATGDNNPDPDYIDGNPGDSVMTVYPKGVFPDDPLNIQWAIDNGAQTGTLTINLGEGTFLCGDPDYNPDEDPNNFVIKYDYQNKAHKVYKHHSKDGSIFIHGNREVILRGAPSTSTGPDGKPAPATTIERGYLPITIGLKPRYKTNPGNPDHGKDPYVGEPGDPYNMDFNFGWAPDYFVEELEIREGYYPNKGALVCKLWTNFKFHLDVMGTVYDDLDPGSPYPYFNDIPNHAPEPSEIGFSGPPAEDYRADLTNDITTGVTFGIEGIRIHNPKGDPILIGAGSGGYIKNCHFVDARPADLSAWLFHHVTTIPEWVLAEWPLSLVQLACIGLKYRPDYDGPGQLPAPVENISGDVSLTDNYFDSQFRMSAVDSNPFLDDGTTPNPNYGRPVKIYTNRYLPSPPNPPNTPNPDFEEPMLDEVGNYFYDEIGVIDPNGEEGHFPPGEFKEAVDFIPKTLNHPYRTTAVRVRGININFCNCVSATDVLFAQNVVKGVGAIGWLSNCFFPHKHDGVPCACKADTTQIKDNEFTNTSFGFPYSPSQDYYAGCALPSWMGSISIDFWATEMLPEHTATVSGNTVNLLPGPPGYATAGIAVSSRTIGSITNNTVNSHNPSGAAMIIANNSNCLVSGNTFSGIAEVGGVFGAEEWPGPNINVTYKNNDASGLTAGVQFVIAPGNENNTFTNNTYGPVLGTTGLLCLASNHTFTNENFIGGMVQLPSPPFPPFPLDLNYYGFPSGRGCISLGTLASEYIEIPQPPPNPPLQYNYWFIVPLPVMGNKITALKEGTSLQGMDLCKQIMDFSEYSVVPYPSPLPPGCTPPYCLPPGTYPATIPFPALADNCPDAYCGLNDIPGIGRCYNVPEDVLEAVTESHAKALELIRKKWPYM